MGLEQVEIVQCVGACFVYNELPIAIWVADLLEKRIHSVHQTEVAGHDVLNTLKALIYWYVHIGAGDIGFKGFGLDHCHMLVGLFTLLSVTCTELIIKGIGLFQPKLSVSSLLAEDEYYHFSRFINHLPSRKANTQLKQDKRVMDDFP
jgi:hypothetical protein